MMMMVVKNGTDSILPIPELKQRLPADGKFYVIPLDIAKKYCKYLIPVKVFDDTPTQETIPEPTTTNQNVKIDLPNVDLSKSTSAASINTPVKKKAGRPKGSKSKTPAKKTVTKKAE